MFKRLIHCLIFLCLTCLISLLQISFANSLPICLNLLLVLVVLLVYLDYPAILPWLFLASLLVEFYSIYPFGLSTFSLLIVALIVYWLRKNIFVKQSVLVLFFISIGNTLIYQIIIFLFNGLTYLFKLSKWAVTFNNLNLFILLKYTFFNTLLILLFYLICNLIRHKKINQHLHYD